MTLKANATLTWNLEVLFTGKFTIGDETSTHTAVINSSKNTLTVVGGSFAPNNNSQTVILFQRMLKLP